MTRRLTLALILTLAPAAALAQPPPTRTVAVARRSTLTRQSPILTTSLRPMKASRIAPDRAKRIQPRRVRVRAISQPSSLHLLGSSLQSLPPALPPALLNQPTPPPNALRQLRSQFELLQVRSPH